MNGLQKLRKDMIKDIRFYVSGGEAYQLWQAILSRIDYYLEEENKEKVMENKNEKLDNKV